MKLSSLDYPLPEHAIAQRPAARRDAARLLVVGEAGLEHRQLVDWPKLVPSGALVVLNDTRVRRARLLCAKPTGGQVELLFLRAQPGRGLDRELWTVLARPSRSLRPGTRLVLGGAHLEVVERLASGEVLLEVSGHGDTDAFLEQHGQVPLPPYIRRAPEEQDVERYQTVFGQHLGSVAAPTAGLHVTREMLTELVARGVHVGFATLHVGAGTFLPVRTEDLDEHPMHSEAFAITAELAEQVAAARRRGAPVIAVGTTVVRALESARDEQRHGHVLPGAGETRLLIQPGFRFEVVDAMLTNFHAPKSTLLALVSAFVGQGRCRAAYEAALARGYRFLSYGEAMWLPSALPDVADEGAAP